VEILLRKPVHRRLADGFVGAGFDKPGEVSNLVGSAMQEA